MQCNVCGSDRFKLIYGGILKRCSECSFTTINMEFDTSVIKKIYSEKYFKGEEFFDYLQDKDVMQHNFRRRIEAICKITDKKNIRNCLEIGCAYGFFGEMLTDTILTNYLGIDIVDEAIDYGRNELKLNVLRADYLSLSEPENKYTDVFMWDVIEHLMNPEKFIEKISHEISKNGRLYITTGDIGSILAKIRRCRWRMIHVPSHVHFFSKNTLSLLVQNYGFKVKEILYLPVSRSLRQMFYFIFILNKRKSKILNSLHDHIPINLYITMNTYDIMMLIAVKS